MSVKIVALLPLMAKRMIHATTHKQNARRADTGRAMGAAEMTLQEAIERVGQVSGDDPAWLAEEFTEAFDSSVAEAISVILNAVVKGELK